MKITKILSACLISLGFISTTFAADEGFYFGGQIGQGTLQTGAQNINTGTSLVRVGANNSGFAGRLFGGLQGSRYFGFEGGYTYFSSPRYKDIPTTVCGQPFIRYQAVDIVGKGIFPFLNTLFNIGLEAFVKGGLSITAAQKSISLNSSPPGCGVKKTFVKVLPTAGFGISYDITQNLVVDLTYSRIFSTSKTQVPNANFVALGLSYHAVSLKCGQFLC